MCARASTSGCNRRAAEAEAVDDRPAEASEAQAALQRAWFRGVSTRKCTYAQLFEARTYSLVGSTEY